MKEKDIQRMIDETAAWRCEADRSHLEALGRHAADDLRRWQHRRMLVWNVAASVAVVVVAGAYTLLLPQRVDDRRVLCNVRGEEALVVNRACSAIGTCSNPAVARILPDGGVFFNYLT